MQNSLAGLPASGLVLLVSLGVSGCLDDVAAPEVRAWQGTLVSVEESGGLGGSVAALARHRSTEAGITLRNVEPATSYLWSISTGDCAEPDELEPIGPFPLPVSSAEGTEASREVGFAGEMNRGTSYAGAVYDAQGDQLLACGNMRFTASPGS